MGYTCAHYAVELARDGILTVLLSYRQILNNSNDQRRRTPLQRATYDGSNTKVSLLISTGADANARDTGEEAPLSGACAAGNGYQGMQKIYGENVDNCLGSAATPEFELMRERARLNDTSLPSGVHVLGTPRRRAWVIHLRAYLRERTRIIYKR